MSQKIILFQGDSITDCGRDKENLAHNGRGYAHLVEASLKFTTPYQYTCYNRGIGGNRVVDLYARIQKDMINLSPDYISILVGINDVLHEYTQQNGVDAKKFEMVYRLMIEELLKNLPHVKIMILEPFVLPGLKTCNHAEDPFRWDYFRRECDLRRAAAQRIAEKYSLLFVPLQHLFNDISASAPEGYWIRDGIHPTPAGHELIKTEWLKAFAKIQ